MPSSSKEGKDIVVQWVREISNPINNILDLGTGKGTYRNLFRKKRMLEDSFWTGVEVWKPYIEQFDLESKYDLIINEDIRKINFSKIKNIDLTFVGDVLEHMTKEEALTVINDLAKYSKYIIISLPIIHYPQNEVNNNPYEVHVKDDWSHEEVLSSFQNIKKSWIGSEIGVYLLCK